MNVCLGGGDFISNLDILLGTSAASCFSDSTRHFGKQSVFCETQFGIMLLGNVRQMISDLDCLPSNLGLPDSCNSAVCADAPFSDSSLGGQLSGSDKRT